MRDNSRRTSIGIGHGGAQARRKNGARWGSVLRDAAAPAHRMGPAVQQKRQERASLSAKRFRHLAMSSSEAAPEKRRDKVMSPHTPEGPSIKYTTCRANVKCAAHTLRKVTVALHSPVPEGPPPLPSIKVQPPASPQASRVRRRRAPAPSACQCVRGPRSAAGAACSTSAPCHRRTRPGYSAPCAGCPPIRSHAGAARRCARRAAWSPAQD